MATDWSSRCTFAENYASSELNVAKATQVWTINNFDFAEAKGSKMDSPVFSSSTNDKAKWYMRIDPNAKTDNKDAIELALFLHKNSEYKKVFAKYSFIVFDNEQGTKISKVVSAVREFFPDGTGWTCGKFCKKDENFRRKLVLSKNVLKISCEVIFSEKGDVVFEHNDYSSPPLKSTIANCHIAENLGKLLETHHFSDVVISVANKDYPAHKAILTAQSKVFAAMFQHDTKENLLNRVDIEDLGEEVVGEMLHFIYTGRCEKLEELAEGLLAAADKYDLDPLKTMCSQTLCRNLSIENAARNLIAADMHNAIKLKKTVLKFVVAKSKDVFDTEGWKSVLTNPRLVDEIFRAMAH